MSSVFLEELEVLSSIYSDCVSSEDIENGEFIVKYTHKSPDLVGRFFIPSDYPSNNPVFSVSIANNKLSDKIKSELESRVRQCIVDGGGEVVLFSCIQVIVDLVGSEVVVDEDDDSIATDSTTVIVQRPMWCLSKSSSTLTPSGDFTIITDTYHFNASLGVDSVFKSPSSAVFSVMHGSVSEVLKSTFQSHIAVVHSMEDVRLFRNIVLTDKKAARATHNIFAYRFTSADGLVHHDTDDDGETAASAKIGEMLRLMNVSNIAVIVSRWYGGINLGPNRFKCICNSARKLIEEYLDSKR